MNIIDLAEEVGLLPRRKSATGGVEYCSPCPDLNCGGMDRFCMWPEQGTHGKYWCRVCGKRGDAIQFCRDFLNLGFKEACSKVGKQPELRRHCYKSRTQTFKPICAEQPLLKWIESARGFIEEAHQYLMSHSYAYEAVRERGIKDEAICKYKIGFNPTDKWASREDWGICDADGRKVWLAKGLVIPAFNSDTTFNKIKIRRTEWVVGDQYPKYVEVSGSSKWFPIYGNSGLPIVIVESEFDAILIEQEAGLLCQSLAIGGAGKKPDMETDRLLKSAPNILFCLDYDHAGFAAYKFWKCTYPVLRAWPVPFGKSPGDAFLTGLDLKHWIQCGLKTN